MAKVLAFGTFDGFHHGHRFYLEEASKRGALTVVVARDATVIKVKGRLPKHSEEERLAEVRRAGYDALLGSTGDKYAVLSEIHPDVICLGYDQTHFTEGLAEECRKRGLAPEIVRIPAHHPERYKSSILNH